MGVYISAAFLVVASPQVRSSAGGRSTIIFHIKYYLNMIYMCPRWRPHLDLWLRSPVREERRGGVALGARGGGVDAHGGAAGGHTALREIRTHLAWAAHMGTWGMCRCHCGGGFLGGSYGPMYDVIDVS